MSINLAHAEGGAAATPSHWLPDVTMAPAGDVSPDQPGQTNRQY